MLINTAFSVAERVLFVLLLNVRVCEVVTVASPLMILIALSWSSGELDKFNDILRFLKLPVMVLSESQELNIYVTLDTFEASNLSPRLMKVRRLQPNNMQYMFVTFCVLKFDTSKEVRELQPWNMLCMFVTFCVLKFDTSKEVRELQL